MRRLTIIVRYHMIAAVAGHRSQVFEHVQNPLRWTARDGLKYRAGALLQLASPIITARCVIFRFHNTVAHTSHIYIVIVRNLTKLHSYSETCKLSHALSIPTCHFFVR